MDSTDLRQCKIVGFDPSGKLHFHSENLHILIENAKKLYDEKKPASILAVTGPPKCGKTFYTNLVIQNLRENGGRGWFKKLLKGQPLSGFPFGEETGGTATLPDADIQNDGIYIYPNSFFLIDTRNEHPLWLLDLVLRDDECYKTHLEAMLATLLLLCSQLIEIQIEDEKSVLDRIIENLKSSSFTKDFVCRSIMHLKRGSTENENEINSKIDCCVPNLKESLHDASGQLNSTLASELWGTIIQPVKDILSEENLTPKLTGNRALTILKMEGYFKMCVEMVNEHVLGSSVDKAPAKNIASENNGESTSLGESKCESTYDSFPFNHCKIVNRRPNGELYLLRENLESILTTIHSKSTLPVLLLSMIGPPASGKSIFTNLIMEYLKKEGEGGWINTFSKENSPLVGFAYGHGENLVTKNCFVPDDISSGIYIWPYGFTLPEEAKFQICLMHVNYKASDKWKGPLDSLQALLALSCGMVVELKNSENMAGPAETLGEIIKLNQLPKMIRYFLQAGTKNASKRLRPHQNFANIEYHYVYRAEQPLHDKSGQLRLGRSHNTTFTSSIQNIFEENQFSQINAVTKKVEEIARFLQHQINEINGNPTFSPSIQKEEKHETSRQPCVSENLLVPVKHTENSSTPKLDDEAIKNSERISTNSNTSKSAGEGSDETEIIKELVEKINITKLLKKTEREMETWIEKKHTLSEFANFAEIFKEILNTVLLKKLKANKISKDKETISRKKVVQEVSNRITESSVIPQIHCLQTQLVALHKELCDAFTEQGCLPLTVIPSVLQNHVEQFKKNEAKELSKNETNLEKLFSKACKKVADIYQNHNIKIHDDENNLLLECDKKVQTSFLECLEWIQKCGPLPPNDMQNYVHQAEEKHFHAFHSLLPDSLDQQKIDELREKMITALNGVSAPIVRKNDRSLEKYKKTVTTLISNSKEKYTLAMDEVVGENPRGIEKKQFHKIEKQHRGESVKVLREELEKLNPKEPKDCHHTALIEHLDKILEDYNEENNENLEKSDSHMEVDPDPDLHTIEEENQNSLKEPNANHDVIHLKNEHGELRPLIFQISMQTMTISQPINETGEFRFPYLSSSIPAFIGVTKTNSWVIGPDLEAADKKGSIQTAWCIGTCLCPEGGNTWSDAIPMNEEGETQNMTIEFLLGYFLRLVKDKVEQIFSAKSPSIIIIVPHWLASAQRQRIKDSAVVAGYVNNHLVNDTYALGHSLLLKEDAFVRRQKMVVVISENSATVDLCIYELHHDRRALSKALVHVGDYEVDKSVKGTNRYNESNELNWQNMWDDARKHLDVWKHKHWEYTEKETVFLVSWRSNSFGAALNKFIKKIRGKSHSFEANPSETEYYLALAANDIYRNNMLDKIVGRLTYDILAISLKKNFDKTNSPHIALAKESSTKAGGEVEGSAIPRKSQIGHQLFQNSVNGPVVIGEEIVTLSSVELSHSLHFGHYKQSVTPNSNWWRTARIDTEKIGIYSSLIDFLENRSKLLEMKELFFLKANQILTRVEKYPFKSSGPKTLIKQEVNKRVDALKATNSTKEEVVEADEVITSFYQKYSGL